MRAVTALAITLAAASAGRPDSVADAVCAVLALHQPAVALALLGRHGRCQLMGGGDRPAGHFRTHGARFDHDHLDAERGEPKKLTSNRRRHSSSAKASTGTLTPMAALLTSARTARPRGSSCTRVASAWLCLLAVAYMALITICPRARLLTMCATAWPACASG